MTKMCMKTRMIFFLLIGLVNRLHAEISITVSKDSGIAGDSRLKCNSKAVLICSIQPYTIMTWTVDKIVSDCTFEQCNNYGTHYEFSFDTKNGIFNLTMNPVLFTDNGKIFKCGDGNTSASLLAQVDIIPDISLTSISSSKKKHSTDIWVTTGCFYPSSGIKFEWYYFEADQTPELYTFNRSIQSTTEDGCTNGQCGGTGVVKITNTLSINEEPFGDNFYFQVLIRHPDTSDVIVKADRPFKLQGNNKQTTPAVGDAISNCKMVTLDILTIALYLIMKIF